MVVQHSTDVWFIFSASQFQVHKMLTYLEIILPWIIIHGNMDSRLYFPLLQVLVILLCFRKSQTCFPTAIFMFPSQSLNKCTKSKDGLLLYSILRVFILWFSFCFFLSNKKKNLTLTICFWYSKRAVSKIMSFFLGHLMPFLLISSVSSF